MNWSTSPRKEEKSNASLHNTMVSKVNYHLGSSSFPCQFVQNNIPCHCGCLNRQRCQSFLSTKPSTVPMSISFSNYTDIPPQCLSRFISQCLVGLIASWTKKKFKKIWTIQCRNLPSRKRSPSPPVLNTTGSSSCSWRSTSALTQSLQDAGNTASIHTPRQLQMSYSTVATNLPRQRPECSSPRP